MSSPKEITVAEAAEIIGVSRMQVGRYIAAGLLPARTISRIKLVPRKAAEAFRRRPRGRKRSES